MADEAELCEGEAQKAGNAERPPRAPHEDQGSEARRERQHGQRDHEAVVSETAVQQAGLADLLGQKAEFGRVGLQSGGNRHSSVPAFVVERYQGPGQHCGNWYETA